MKKIISMFSILLLISACGGGGGSSAPSGGGGAAAVGAKKGVFIDAEVKGLSYTTSSGVKGVTDKNGTYAYNAGDTISFSIGGVDIGTVAGAPKCTPTDFGAAKLNIARFIQSLDADGDPSNGIDLSVASTKLAGTTISSDAFTADAATFAANADIVAALVTTGDDLIPEAQAETALTAGTKGTFVAADLENKTFVVIDALNVDLGLGIVTFETGNVVNEVFFEDTTAGGGNGSGFTETWTVGTDGVLVLTDPAKGTVIKVTRVGGSSRAISANVLNSGETEAKPLTLLIPQPVTVAGLGGNGTTVTSKAYDVTLTDGTPLVATFHSDGAFTSDQGDVGRFRVDANNIIAVFGTVAFPNDTTFLALLGDHPTAVGQLADILILDTTKVAGTTKNNEIGIGSMKLKSITLAGSTGTPSGLACGTQSGTTVDATTGLDKPITPYSFAQFEGMVDNCGGTISPAITVADIKNHTFNEGGEIEQFDNTGSGTVADPGHGVLGVGVDDIAFSWYLQVSGGKTYIVLDASLTSNVGPTLARERIALTSVTGTPGVTGVTYTAQFYTEFNKLGDNIINDNDGEIWNSTITQTN